MTIKKPSSSEAFTSLRSVIFFLNERAFISNVFHKASPCTFSTRLTCQVSFSSPFLHSLNLRNLSLHRDRHINSFVSVLNVRLRYHAVCYQGRDARNFGLVVLVMSREAFVGPPTAFLRRGTRALWVSSPGPSSVPRQDGIGDRAPTLSAWLES